MLAGGGVTFIPSNAKGLLHDKLFYVKKNIDS